MLLFKTMLIGAAHARHVTRRFFTPLSLAMSHRLTPDELGFSELL